MRALEPLFDDPAYILKRELQWLPVFGWLTIKARMVPVDRGAGALTNLAERARAELARGRQLIIFPAGTRRPPGAEPRYTRGIVHLYALPRCSIRSHPAWTVTSSSSG